MGVRGGPIGDMGGGPRGEAGGGTPSWLDAEPGRLVGSRGGSEVTRGETGLPPRMSMVRPAFLAML